MNTIVTSPTAASPGLMSRIREVLSLFKLRIGIMIVLTALAGAAFVPGPAPGFTQWVTLALAILLSSAAAGGFNQYYEREADRRMARTRARAFVTGALTPRKSWLAVFVLMLVASFSLAATVINVQVAVHTLLGGLVYGLIYTVWLKRRSAWNIVIGGASGSFAVLAGAAMIDPTIGPLGWALAGVLFLWTPPHFWSLAIANRADYAAAGVPMLPVVVGNDRAASIVFWSALALVLVSVSPALFGASPLYVVAAVAGGIWFLRLAYRLMRSPVRTNAMAVFFASMAHLALLLGAASLDKLFR